MKQQISITFTDGNVVQTQVNGTQMEVLHFYRENNFSLWLINNQLQVIRIDFPERIVRLTKK